MKYVVLVPDGCADEPLAELDGRTPLEAAAMPALSRLAARAEVVRRLHQSLAEMILPDAIDHDASGERILLVGDPRGQQVAPAASIIRWHLLPAENL